MINVTLYGATGDGVTDDTAAIMAAYAALGANGRGELYCPGYGCGVAGNVGIYNYTQLIFDDSYGLHLRGDSSLWASSLRCTATSSAGGVKARSSTHFSADFICFDYISNLFTNYLVDLTWSALTPHVDTGQAKFRNCSFTSISSGGGINPGNKFSAIGVNLNKANNCSFDGCYFQGLYFGVQGQDSAGLSYSSGHSFRNCQMGANVLHSVQDIGMAWLFENCSVNPNTGGKPAFIKCDTRTTWQALSIIGGFFGDVLADDCFLILSAGEGLTIQGGKWHGRTNSGLLSALGGIKGLNISGNSFYDFGFLTVPQVTTGNEGWIIQSNSMNTTGTLLTFNNRVNFVRCDNNGTNFRRYNDNVKAIGAAVTNSGTGVTTLATHTILANRLNDEEMPINFVAFGTALNNAAAKTIRVNFGGTDVFTYPLQVSATGSWRIEGDILHKTTNQQAISVTGNNNGSAALTQSSTQTKTETSNITLLITGQGGASSDITLTGFRVNYF